MKNVFSFAATNEKGSCYILEFETVPQGDVHVLLSCAMLEGRYVAPLETGQFSREKTLPDKTRRVFLLKVEITKYKI